eukprot:m.148416 g.148416  ORF g.148416 m.148416 type:complete len:75 (-) comp14997_c1_seq11:192-416(-)
MKEESTREAPSIELIGCDILLFNFKKIYWEKWKVASFFNTTHTLYSDNYKGFRHEANLAKTPYLMTSGCEGHLA